MKRCLLVIITIILFSNVLALDCNGTLLNKNSKLLNKNDGCPIENILPKDDAFHGIQSRFSIEWWYFDAVFDTHYGIHVGIKVISFGRWGFVKQLVNLYNDSKVEEKAYITKPLNQFQISKEFPDIRYNYKNLLEFDYEEYNKTGNWKYTVRVDVKNLAVNLTFVSETQGFKYETAHEGWTVAQPKAKVKGSLKIDDKIIKVKGKGYHDHNWNFSLSTGLRCKGWYWGKVNSENYTLTWAKIMKTHFADETIVKNLGVLNVINQGHEFIHPENITFTASKRNFYHGRFIPTVFTLKIVQGKIEVNVTFNAVSIQRTPPNFLTVHYWRYFVSINGYIKMGGNVDYLDDDLQIIEFIRFI